ncbi:MAG: transglycosylase domain-containing protein, partial [Rhodospirillaceae bacterium]|nr:transglycosylase domain-containing protein [Rhodospirillaceae bacterium]
MRRYVRLSGALGALAGAGLLGIVALISGGYFYVAPGLPQAEELRDVRVQIPLSIYSRDGRLISQFGERRTPVALQDVPPVIVEAVLAAEDDRFFEHPGIDYQGTLRAILLFVLNAGEPEQGGSSITQQIARQYFLTRDRTLVRKFKEWILAIRI